MEPLSYFNGPEQPIRYWTAYRFVFSSRQSWQNLLLGGVCLLIPVAGQMVVGGYAIEVTAHSLPDERSGYADFDFNRFVNYLTVGLWPMLVGWLAMVAIILPSYLVLALGIMGISAAGSNGPMQAIAIISLMVLVMGAWFMAMLLIEPLIVRAALTQEFGGAFNWPWIKDLVRRIWRELILSTLFLGVTAIPPVIAGYLMCMVGLYPVIALLVMARWHLSFQLYRLYLSRGGSPVPPRVLPLPPPVAMPPPLP